MDVTCERCHAEYEFDDALVGARGTMVRCTECDATFRIAATGRGSERFRVVAPGGAVRDYENLRELREAVREGVVDGNFLLVDGEGGGRPLSSVDELRDWLRDSPIPLVRDAYSSEVPSTRNSAPPTKERDSVWELVRPSEVSLLPDYEAGRERASVPPLSLRPSVPPPKMRSASRSMAEIATLSVASLPPVSLEPTTVPEPPPSFPARSQPAPTTSRMDARPSEEPPRVARVVAERVQDTPREPTRGEAHRARDFTRPLGAAEPTPATLRHPERPHAKDAIPGSSNAPSSDVSLFHEPPPRRGGYFAAGGVLLVALAFVGYRVTRAPTTTAIVPSASASTVATVAAPNYTMALDEGRIEDAEKALADAPPSADRALGDFRVSVVRAEFATWRSLLAKGPAKVSAEADRKALVAEAVRRADGIPSGSSNALTLARIDEMRLNGNVGRGRALVTPALQNDPLATYSLTALDFAQGSPDWSKLLEPLRKAAALERHAGRARVALAYALSQTGDTAGALLEANRVRASCDDRALADALASFVGLTVEGAPSATSTSKTDAPPVANPNGIDAATLTKQADQARAAGKKPEARALYRRALAASPGYLPALTGLSELETDATKGIDPKHSEAYPPGPNTAPLPKFELPPP